MIAVILLAACGCVGPRMYLKQRLHDAADPFRADISAGKGLHANVNATRYLALGAGACTVTRAGGRRGQWGAWDEKRSDFNVIVPLFGQTTIRKVFWGNVERTVPLDCDGVLPLSSTDKTRGALEVSANLHVLAVGAELGLDVGELGDFLLGWFGLDPMQDDIRDPFKAVNHPSAGIRIRGLHHLAFVSGDEALNAIQSVLSDPEPTVRVEALHTLMARCEARCVPAIVPLLDDLDSAVQTQAAVAISHIDGVRFKKSDKVAEARRWWQKTGRAKYQPEQ